MKRPNIKSPEILTQMTPEELIAEIGKHLEILDGNISSDREHAVNSQLRACLRHLGYRPRETKEKPVTITELHAQLTAALAAESGEVRAENFEYFIRYGLAVLSNLVWECQAEFAPDLKEAPAPQA